MTLPGDEGELAGVLLGREAPELLEIPSLDEREVIAQSARLAAESCGADGAVVMLADPERRQLICEVGFPPELTIDPIPIDSDLPTAHVFRGDAAIVISDLGDFPMTLPRAVKLGISSVLIVRVNGHSSPVGCMLLGGFRPRRWSSSDVRQAEATARHLGLSIEKARQYREATDRIADLSVIQDVASALSRGEPLSTVLDSAARRLTALIDASGCFVLLVDPKSGDLRGAAGIGEQEEARRTLRIPAGPVGSLSQLALSERRPIAVYDATTDPRANPTLVERFGDKSLLAVPMIHGGKPIGSLLFDETRTFRRFSEKEIDRVQAVASHLAAAVENARLNEDLRRSYAELETTQAQLVGRERLAALGELAAAVAHEVRNPLGAIFNVLGGLRRRWSEDGEIGTLLSILEEEADRINRIIGDLLDFAKPHELAVESVPVAEVIEDAAAASITMPGIDLDLAVEPGIDRVAMDRRQIRQALLNLFVNAVQAMGDRGRLRVVVRRGEWNGAAAVVVDVEDDGPGVDPHLRDRIFEPFFTTKATGTGLGLAVVRRILEGHGGGVTVASGAPRGAVFSLHLPEQPGAKP